MSADFQYDVFLSHNQANKPRVRRLAERLRAAGLPPNAKGRRLRAKVKLQPSAFILQPFPLVGLERSIVGTGNLPFRDPANAGRRFIPLPMADAHHRKEPVAICDLESA